jgi:hypothetical protein
VELYVVLDSISMLSAGITNHKKTMDQKQILLSLYASLWEAKALLPESIKTIEDLLNFIDNEVIPSYNDDSFDTFKEDQAQAALYLSMLLDKN